MTTKKAQRRAEAIAPDRSLILTRKEQKTVFPYQKGAKPAFTSSCCISVFTKDGSNCFQFTGPDWLVCLDKLRVALPSLP